MAGTTFAAVVRIVDLPVATTITGSELMEVVQTSGGVGQSVQVALSNSIPAASIGTSQLATSLGVSGTLSVGTTIVVGQTVTVQNALAIPAGGTAAVLFSSTSGFGIFFGSGAPSVSAATGSIYCRSDPANATSRIYVNITGTGVWTPLTAFS